MEIEEVELEGNPENELILQVNISEEVEENLENMVIEYDKKDDIERIDEDDDISIQIPEKERDISTVGISTAN